MVMETAEEFWKKRAENAEMKLETMKQGHTAAIEKVTAFKQNFGVREKMGGVIDIDFDVFVDALGIEAAFELRKIIDDKYQISGAPGEKPKVRLTA